MVRILQGRSIADKVLNNLRQKVKRRHLRLKIAAVLVGKNPASELFIQKKKQACNIAGIDFILYCFPERISQKELEKKVKKIAAKKQVSGLVIQLPLPKGMDVQRVLNLVPLAKDVDCLSKDCRKRFATRKSKVLPPVVGAIKKIFQAYRIKIKGKKVLVVGKGRLVGQPLIAWLSKTEETGSPPPLQVLVADKSTKNLAGLCRQADIIISGVGKAGLIRGEMIKKGAVIIDVGSSKKGGKIVGDVDFESCAEIAGAISPVPGGVGPLTVACLLENLIKLNNPKNLRS